MDPLEMQPCIMSARFDTCLWLNEGLQWCRLINSANLAGAAMTLGGCTKQRPLIVLRTLEQLNCSYTMPCLHCHDESVKLIVSAGEHQQQRSRRGSTHSSF